MDNASQRRISFEDEVSERIFTQDASLRLWRDLSMGPDAGPWSVEQLVETIGGSAVETAQDSILGYLATRTAVISMLLRLDAAGLVLFDSANQRVTLL